MKKGNSSRYYLYTIGYSLLGLFLLFLAGILCFLVSKCGLLESSLFDMFCAFGLYTLASISCLWGLNYLMFVFHIVFLNYD